MAFFSPSIKASEDKLRSLCELAKEVNPESDEFPYLGRKIRLRGITRRLKALYHPDGGVEGVKKKKRGKYGSSTAIGTRVHRAIRHATTCVARDDCTCPTKTRPGKLHKFAVSILEELKKRNCKMVECEVPVGSFKLGYATKLDAVCDVLGTLCVISFKTGSRCARSFGGKKFSPPLDSIQFSEKNADQLQGACELAMLRRIYGIEGVPYYLVTAAKKCEWRELDTWARDVKTQDAIFESLRSERSTRKRTPARQGKRIVACEK